MFSKTSSSNIHYAPGALLPQVEVSSSGRADVLSSEVLREKMQDQGLDR